MKLYGHPMSPRFRRVAIAAAELKAPVEQVVLNIGAGENRAPDYLARNPMGKIPTFEDDDGWTLWESFAIVTYLADTHPNPALFPVATDARGRADALRWMFWGASHLDASIVPIFVNRVLNALRGQPCDENAVANGMKELERYLPVLESHLAKQPWLLGPSFTIVDAVVGVTLDGLFHPKVAFDRDRCPKAAEWHQRMSQRPSWISLALKG